MRRPSYSIRYEQHDPLALGCGTGDVTEFICAETKAAARKKMLERVAELKKAEKESGGASHQVIFDDRVRIRFGNVVEHRGEWSRVIDILELEKMKAKEKSK